MSNAERHNQTIGEYLIQALYDAGAQHVFGVPGDYILGFYDLMAKSPLQLVGTTREDTAGFAADGYARCQGIGTLAVTYGVGALSTVNAIAGAYAESSPVVVISGAPGVSEQRDDPLLHHRFGPFTFQREIFERITCATAVLDDPVMAFRQIDRTLAAAQRYRKPVYIELPRDHVTVRGFAVPAEPEFHALSDASALAEAVQETIELLSEATTPVVVAGIELHRRGLQDALIELVERSNLPIAATLTGKSVFAERHPAYIGIYEGAMSSVGARERVEQADLLLMLGVSLNDVDTGVYTAKLDPNKMVHATQEEVNIRHHRYPRVILRDYVTALTKVIPSLPSRGYEPSSGPQAPGFPHSNQIMTISRLIGRINQALTPDMMVICDTGDCLFSAIELRVHQNTEFFASAFYTSMGFAVPAALGAQLARPDRRALILVGDGAFQMTGTELSTHARQGLCPIVIVLNNHGYSTERMILDGPFNDISEWQFENLGQVFGPLHGYKVTTETEFEEALLRATKMTNAPSLINVHLDVHDASPAVRRLGEHLGSMLAR